jgi:hypothetical protein
MREILVEADEMQQTKEKEQDENQVKDRDYVPVYAGSAHDDRANPPNDERDYDCANQPHEGREESRERTEWSRLPTMPNDLKKRESHRDQTSEGVMS